ncbi:MAG: hypothetical protein R6X02_13090 [Enhygromyxa sp.]
MVRSPGVVRSWPCWLLLAAVACHEETDAWSDHTFAWHGEHVSVYGYGYEEADLCGGSLAELEGHTALIEDALGLEGPPYVFRWISDDEWTARTPCPLGSFCARDGAAIARVIPQMQQATLAILDQAAVECPALLEDGLGVLFNGPTPSWELDPTEYEITELLEYERVPVHGSAHVRAGHFVAFLAERHGFRSILDLCQALPQRPTLTQWSLATAAVLDEPLTELLGNYSGYPLCDSQQLRARLWGCKSPDLTFTGELHVAGDCSDPQATNAPWTSWWGDYGDALLLRRVYFPDNALVRISTHAQGPSGVGARFASTACAPCSEVPSVVRGDGEGGGLGGLELYTAGLHEFVVYFDRRDSVELDMWEEAL